MTQPKTARKSRAKLSIVTPGDDAPQLAPSTMDMVPLALLNRAAENVRHTAPDAAIEELADDIAAHGLLQGLIGYRLDDDKVVEGAVWITAGGRRLQALNVLLARGVVGQDFPVPLLIRDREEAIELSLAENLARRDMNPADEFVAFAALMRPGVLSVADLAKRFGFTEQLIRQRLRLASLAPVILDALRENRLTLTACYAYASTADVTLQTKVFEQQEASNYGGHSDYAIRQAYRNLQATTESRLFKFVGGDAYEAAGGEYDDDLFSDVTDPDGERRLRNGDLLLGLAEPLVEPLYEAIIREAKLTYPTLHMVDLCPGYIGPDDFGGKMPKAPSGFVQIAATWESERSVDDALIYAVENRIEVSFGAGLDKDGKLALVTDRFFVPADKKGEVQPPRPTHDYNDPARVAEREAERLEASIMGHAVRLAALDIRKNAVEGRTFWKNNAYAWRPEERDGLGVCYSVTQEIYVTAEEAEAYREEGRKLHEAEQDAMAARLAARDAELAKSETDRKAAIATIVDEAPAFVAIVDGSGECVDAYRKLETGQYAPVDDDADAEGEPLIDVLDAYGSAYQIIGYATRDELDAIYGDE